MALSTYHDMASLRILNPTIASASITLEVSSRGSSSRKRLDAGIPPILRPLIRAYLLGYASAVAPRLLALILQQIIGSRRQKAGSENDTAQQKPREPFVQALQRILRSGSEWQRFPTFCTAIVGGSTILEVPLKVAFDRLAQNLTELSRKRLSRWTASFVAAWLSLLLLQSKPSAAFTETVPGKSELSPGAKYTTIRYAGRTLDLTLFAATRAIDVIVGEVWARRKTHRVSAQKWTRVEALISNLTDSGMFAIFSGLIMWTWFYNPSRLPGAYNKWIGSAAAVDGRLTEALRRCRNGELVYGKDTGQASLLGAMCVDYQMPEQWGDPAVTIPYPCDIVHMGSGPSCEYHALSRFLRAFKWSMATYLPLNLLLVIRSPNIKGLVRALKSAARSSAFLGAFITLFYYGVCLARTRLGPRILGTSRAARQHIDGGLCVGTGCFLCGWSILIERATRRKDMALFVAPRALATLLPRRYAWEKQWRETAVFAFSTAVVFTSVLENKKRVRGVLGTVLDTVLTP